MKITLHQDCEFCIVTLPADLVSIISMNSWGTLNAGLIHCPSTHRAYGTGEKSSFLQFWKLPSLPFRLHSCQSLNHFRSMFFFFRENKAISCISLVLAQRRDQSKSEPQVSLSTSLTFFFKDFYLNSDIRYNTVSNWSRYEESTHLRCKEQVPVFAKCFVPALILI